MSRADTMTLVARFLAALDAADGAALDAMLDEDVVHELPGGRREIGVDAFRAHLAIYGRHFQETIADIAVMADEGGMRAAAEFTRRGRYRASMAGLPEASGQSYSVNAGLFLEIEDGRIVRITDPCGIAAVRQAIGATDA